MRGPLVVLMRKLRHREVKGLAGMRELDSRPSGLDPDSPGSGNSTGNGGLAEQGVCTGEQPPAQLEPMSRGRDLQVRGQPGSQPARDGRAGTVL